MRPCPCGCGAEFIPMVAERETGLRSDTEAVRPTVRLPASDYRCVFLLTGVPGAGKSTVGRLLALQFDRAAHIDIDMVYHHFTVAGLAQPTSRSDEASRQDELAIANAAALATNYVDAGFVCVLEGAVVKRSLVIRCADVVAPHPLHLVVLAPPLEVSEQRDADRTGKHVAAEFRYLHPLVHEELAGLGLWLDTSEHTPADTVRMVLAHRDRARLA